MGRKFNLIRGLHEKKSLRHEEQEMVYLYTFIKGLNIIEIETLNRLHVEQQEGRTIPSSLHTILFPYI